MSISAHLHLLDDGTMLSPSQRDHRSPDTVPCSCGANTSLDGLVVCEAAEIVTAEDFEMFVRDAEPRLRRALIGAVGVDRVPDAVGEALAYAFTHWSEVQVVLSRNIGNTFVAGHR